MAKGTLQFHNIFSSEDAHNPQSVINKPWLLQTDGGFSLESVCAIDDRVKVTAASIFPYKAICKLYMKTPTGLNYVGSGWLTAPDRLYTAGHCLYDHDEGGWMKSIVVIPGMTGDLEPFGRYYAQSIATTSGWIESRSQRFDMGAIKLTSHVNHNEFITPTLTDTSEATICGYPADRDLGLVQYKMRDAVRSEDGRFFYQIDTFGGQSGGPVLKANNQGIGIHNYGGCDNSASDLYQEFINTIAEWN